MASPTPSSLAGLDWRRVRPLHVRFRSHLARATKNGANLAAPYQNIRPSFAYRADGLDPSHQPCRYLMSLEMPTVLLRDDAMPVA